MDGLPALDFGGSMPDLPMLDFGGSMPDLGGLTSLPPISGGDAKSGNGDQNFDGRASFGGIDYNAGMNPWFVVGLVGIAAFVYFMSHK